MENRIQNFKHQATGWDHFRAKNREIEKNISKSNKNNKLFSWIMKTINPLNHIPIIGTIKNINAKAEKSLDVLQSAIGGMIYGGPYGFFKGIGGWVASKVFSKNKNISKNLDAQSATTNKEANLKIIPQSKKSNPISKTQFKENTTYFSRNANTNVEYSRKNKALNEKPSINLPLEKVINFYRKKETAFSKNKIDISA